MNHYDPDENIIEDEPEIEEASPVQNTIDWFVGIAILILLIGWAVLDTYLDWQTMISIYHLR